MKRVRVCPLLCLQRKREPETKATNEKKGRRGRKTETSEEKEGASARILELAQRERAKKRRKV